MEQQATQAGEAEGEASLPMSLEEYRACQFCIERDNGNFTVRLKDYEDPRTPHHLVARKPISVDRYSVLGVMCDDFTRYPNQGAAQAALDTYLKSSLSGDPAGFWRVGRA